MVVKIVNEELCALMGSENKKLNISSKSPERGMLVGLQGAGKTTNGAKLAALMKKQGKRPLLVACDVYRPAAIKQLETVGAQLDIPVFQMGQGDPVEIAKAGHSPREEVRQRPGLPRHGRPPAHRRAAHGRAEEHQGRHGAGRDHCSWWTP